MVSKNSINDNLFRESLNALDECICIVTSVGKIIFSNKVCQKLKDFNLIENEIKILFGDNKDRNSFTHKLQIHSSAYILDFKKLEDKSIYLLKLEEVSDSKKNYSDFYEIVEHANNAVLRIDASGRIKYINQYAQELFGYTSNEIIGKKVIETIIDPVSQGGEGLEEKIDKIRESTQKDKLIEIENITKDGKRLWMSWKTRIVKDELGNTTEFIAIGTDRTEKKTKKEQLVASEERFRRIFEQSSLGIYQTTPGGQIIEINESFAKLFGYNSVKELVDKVVNIPKQLYADPNDRKTIIEKLEKEPDNVAIMETRFKKKNGAVFIGYLHLKKVVGPNNNIFYEGYVEDITDRKSAELALNYSRNKYKHLLETMPHGIDEVNLKGYITYCNTPLEKMLGYSRGELIGKHIADLRPDKMSAELTTDFLESVISTLPKPERVIDKIMTKKGDIIDVQIDWDYQYDENGNVSGFINVISDITGQKASANALKESERRFRGIYENSTIGIYRTTFEGDILLANPAMYMLFGYDSFEEFKNKNASEIYLTPEDRKSFIDKINKDGFVKGFENKGIKKDGTIIYFRESAHSVKNEDGEIIYYDGILEDYTEKKLMEQNLITAKEEAEKADRLKSSFLANMSHEVRTPMNGIMGFSNLLSQKGLSDEHRLRYTKIIQNRGEDLLRIINDILDISKLEVSQLRLHQKEFSLNEFMEQLYVIYKQKIEILEKKELEIKLKLEDTGKNYVLFGDETRIKQILTNYIDNAIKFTERGYIEIGCSIWRDSEIHFYVKDSGIGIPPQMQEIIFERFRQNDETLTRNYGGNGLGLAISKGLAELMNGKVGVYSKENEGSTFYFNLPANFVVQHNEIENDFPKGEQHYWPDKKILLVEDDDVSSALIEEYFDQTEVTVKIAVDGYSALRIIKDEDFNLVLLDIGLPDIIGYEVVKQIKRIKPNLPVIAQTAYAMKDDEIKCKNAGCDGYLQKPIDREILLEKVSEYFIPSQNNTQL